MGDERRLRVVVLTGGTSAEREVCLMSGRKVQNALDPERYESRFVDLADVTRSGNVTPIVSSFGVGERPDVVFVALHGGTGENGTVQGMLELLGVPYTGSGVLASALAMNKILAKKIFEREGIPTPDWVAVRSTRIDIATIIERIGLPCIVKPACEGSTIGVTVVGEAEDMTPAFEQAFEYGTEALVETLLSGTEISGPVLGNECPAVLPLVEIVPTSGFYDFEAKYTPGATEEIVPARIPESTAKRARELTLRAHEALGCQGISRVDMMATAEDVYVLEVNTIPGFTDTSLVPRAAEAMGMSFPQLVDRVIELALDDRGGKGGRNT